MKPLLFVYYYVLALIRSGLYSLSPELYQKYYLKRKTKFSIKNYPFYNRARSFNDFPILKKQEYLQNFADLNLYQASYKECLDIGLAKESSRNFIDTQTRFSVGLSSGTSGLRGIFLTTKKEQIQWIATLLVKIKWLKLFQNHRIALFLRSNSNLYEQTQLSSRFQFQYFDLAQNIDDMIASLVKYQPTVLIAPPYILNELHEKNVFAKIKTNLKEVISVADVLDKKTKLKLEKSLAKPLHQIYQATEGFLAVTCKHHQLHLNEDILFFEKNYIDQDKGVWSPVVTDYFRTTQAINRVSIEDILVESPAKCSCGAKQAVIANIDGRADEILRFNDTQGREVLLYPDYLRHIVQNVLEKAQDYCLVRKPSAIYVKTEFALTDSQIGQISQSMVKLFTDKNINPPEVIFESDLKRQLTEKRKRVFVEST